MMLQRYHGYFHGSTYVGDQKDSKKKKKKKKKNATLKYSTKNACMPIPSTSLKRGYLLVVQ